jgi:hypothetical protein
MSNEIRPTVDSVGRLVLEIAVESVVRSFTWVIVDKVGAIVAGDEVDRDATGKDAPLGQEFSVTVTGKHLSYEKNERERSSAHISPSSPAELPTGDYQVRLYLGHPQASGSPKTKFGKLELLDEDAFSVLGDDVVAPGNVSDVGHPLRVALVREGAKGETEQRSPVTYAEFRKFLEAEWGKNDEYDDANSWPVFGGKPFEALRNAARDFVSQAKVSSFGDLLPPGYVEGKLAETESQFPAIQLPRDARTSYLPGVELIWNYWLEEGMLVQTLNVILARFQNRRLPGRDPLSRFDITPLLPLRNRLWGFAEDEMHRLTVARRSVEYEYEYGFPLIGRAVPRPHLVVERRNGFIATFHQVLYLAHRYFKELDDLTVQADAFPLYRALRDCHIVLSQGSQNQYGEMAVAARAEFLVMQSILAEPQMREFLGGRPMTPYPETWMDRVDSMKTIQGWTDTSILHFNDLATIGEQLVLTIRLGNWADPAVGGAEAGSWAQAFRYGIQKYAAAYRTATGVDLAAEPNTEKPSTLLARRLSGARIRA